MNTKHESPAERFAKQTRQAQACYYRMVETFRPIVRLPLAEIQAMLTAAEKTPAHLVEDVLAAETRYPQPGDPCGECDGQAVIYSSYARTEWVTQYLRCGKCGRTIGKRTVPKEAVRRRRSRKKGG